MRESARKNNSRPAPRVPRDQIVGVIEGEVFLPDDRATGGRDNLPKPRHLLDGEALDNAFTVAADFIDLKSPYMAGHSRRCAQLSAGQGAIRVLRGAGQRLGGP